MALPDRLFIRVLSSQELEQGKDVLKPWVDPHKLKKINGTWWKGDQLVITIDIPQRCTIVQMHHGVTKRRVNAYYTVMTNVSK